MDGDQQADNSAAEDSTQETPQGNALDSVKKRALEALTPLIDGLDLDAERKFDICMSALRFTDNKDLADVALNAALAIEEKGAKAEALVELVNEINYLQQA